MRWRLRTVSYCRFKVRLKNEQERGGQNVISWLSRVLREVELPFILVDVQGVGYELLISLTTASTLPTLGQQVSLYCSLQVREDGWRLYGFASKSERTMFTALLKVGGVGPKSALALLSH